MRGRPCKVRHTADDGKPHKSWEFTDNQLFDQDTGEPDTDRFLFWTRLGREDMASKIMLAKETGDKTQRLHGQGRVCFRRCYRFDALRKLLPPGVHIEATKADSDWCYFAKYGSDILIDIDNRKQGCRNIFKEQVEAIKAGSTITDCIQLEGSNYQSIRSAELLMKYIEPARPYSVRDVCMTNKPIPPTGAYILTNRFWDGYDAHETVYINQRVAKFSIDELRLFAREAPFRVARGRQARYDRLIIFGLDREEDKLLQIVKRI